VIESPAVTDDQRLRIGVIGGGLVAQAVHLPYLAELADRFRIVALAEPSRRVREALGARYGIRHVVADHRTAIDAAELDAVLVCSPNGSHANVVLDALDAGLHVLVEKPLCLDPADVGRIVAARDARGLVVQVGYMKRFDPAFEALADDLPGTPAALSHVATTTYDPWLAPAFRPEAMPRPDDVAPAVAVALARDTRAQVATAVGTDDDADVAAYSDVFLGALVHDVNVVHGLLERIGLDGDMMPLDAGCAPDGSAATALVELPGGARWTMAWLLVPGLGDFREEIALYGRDGVRTLTFPAPYLRQSPAAYRHSAGDVDRNVTRIVRSWREAYARQLAHFHACVTRGERCRTPPEQASRDIELLAALFRRHLGRRA
jgi:predicted dehydrogenase